MMTCRSVSVEWPQTYYGHEQSLRLVLVWDATGHHYANHTFLNKWRSSVQYKVCGKKEIFWRRCSFLAFGYDLVYRTCFGPLLMVPCLLETETAHVVYALSWLRVFAIFFSLSNQRSRNGSVGIATVCCLDDRGSTSDKKKKLHGLSPRANYTDRATAASRRSVANLCG
jgi:hypothetical protein